MLRVLAPASRCVLSCSCRSLKLAATDLKKGTFFDGSALGQPSSRIFKVLETSHVKPGKGAGIVHAKVARTAHTHAWRRSGGGFFFARDDPKQTARSQLHLLLSPLVVSSNWSSNGNFVSRTVLSQSLVESFFL